MILKVKTLANIYLYLTIFYYLGFLNFFTRLLSANTNNYDAFYSNAEGNIYRQVYGIILLCFGLLILLKLDRSILWEAIKKNIWWSLLIAYFFTSMQWSYEPDITLRRTIALSVLLVSAFCIVQCYHINSLLLFIAKSIFLAAIIGLVYVAIDPSNGLSNEGTKTNALMGIYSDKNLGARTYAYGLLILVGLGHIHTLTDKFMLSVLTFCLLIGESISAVVMAIGGVFLIILFEFFRTNNKQQNLIRLLMITLIIILTAVSLSYLYEYILNLFGKEPTLTNRTIIWSLLDEYVEDEYLFGYGFGAFWSSDAVEGFINRWGFIGNAHSGYYEILLNGGKVGFIILMVIITSITRSLLLNYITHQFGRAFSLLIAVFIVQLIINYVGFIVLNHNSFDMFIFSVISFVSYREHTERQMSEIHLKEEISIKII